MKIKKLSAPFSEAEIKQHWKYTDKVYISCVCITFNQKDYIRDAIDSFLAQETEYCFEIIIHDDVSTDGTRDILLEYKDKYPSLIKLVLQDENQYKLGKKITPIAVTYASGEYIAACEGDDFWIDKQKLQKQIVELRKNRDINICFSAAYGLNSKNKISKLCDYKNKQVFNLEDVILGGGGFMPTTSLMIKKEIFDQLPSWYYDIAPVGDYYVQILSSLNSAIFIPDLMVCYRINSNESWSIRRLTNNKRNILKTYENHRKCLFNIFSLAQFSESFQKKVIANIYVAQALDYIIIGEFILSDNILKEHYKNSTIDYWVLKLYYKFPFIRLLISKVLIFKIRFL